MNILWIPFLFAHLKLPIVMQQSFWYRDKWVTSNLASKMGMANFVSENGALMFAKPVLKGYFYDALNKKCCFESIFYNIIYIVYLVYMGSRVLKT